MSCVQALPVAMRNQINSEAMHSRCEHCVSDSRDKGNMNVTYDGLH